MGENDAKTHHCCRVTLDDDEMVALLGDHRCRCEERAQSLDRRVRPDGFLFSPSPGPRRDDEPGRR